MDNSMPTTHSDIDESKVTEQTEKSSPSSTLGGYYVPPLPGTGVDKCNVFVKFLPNEVTDTGLYAMFSKFGEITSYKVMVDPFSGSSLGYGYVFLSHPNEVLSISIAYFDIFGTLSTHSF